jgi:hypothetical protein
MSASRKIREGEGTRRRSPDEYFTVDPVFRFSLLSIGSHTIKRGSKFLFDYLAQIFSSQFGIFYPPHRCHHVSSFGFLHLVLVMFVSKERERNVERKGERRKKK